MTDSRAAAVDLARKGFKVLRVDPYTNRPPLEGWTESATSDPETAHRLFSDPFGESVADNPGVLTGGELLVLDFDCKKGRPGLLSRAELLAEGLPEDTLTVRTATGGIHAYFRVPADVQFRNRVGWRDGVDVRGHHGFVTGPGAVRGDGEYTVIRDKPIADLPARFVEQLSRPWADRPALTAVASEHEDERSIAAAIAALGAVPADEGQRHNSLIAAIHKCFDFGVTPETARDLVEQHVEWFGELYTQDLDREIESVVRGRIRDGKQWGVDYPAPRASLEDVFGDVEPPPAPRLLSFRASTLDPQHAPPRRWYVPDLIPDRTVTLFAGDGGVGKSLLMLQLAAAGVLGREWLGIEVKRGPVVYLSAEDETDEMHRRLIDIGRAEGFCLEDLADLHIIPRAGLDAVLGEPNGRGGIAPTRLWKEVVKLVGEVRPGLVLLDTLSDIYAGEESARPQVRQFVGQVRGLALACACASLIIGHPSVFGMTSGTGTSGSTAWNNSVRSRLYMRRPEDKEHAKREPDLRILETMKQNYAAGVGDERHLVWAAGRFILGAPRVAVEADAEAEFMSLLAKLTQQGRTLAHTKGHSFAPAVFHEQNPEYSTKEYSKAMDRLFDTGAIFLEEYGPPSKRRKRLAVQK